MQQILDKYRSDINEMERLYLKGQISIEERFSILIRRTAELHIDRPLEYAHKAESEGEISLTYSDP
jgi:hypothetical protein